MFKGFRALDRVLRGQATEVSSLQKGSVEVPVGSLIGVLIVLGMIAGACTGLFAVVTRYSAPGHTTEQIVWGWEQMFASTVKVPLLFVLTLLVTFPSLYVFNALVGSRLSMLAMMRLLVTALSVIMAVLASLGPIVAFFAVSTTSYPFMKLLNVLSYSVAGALGLSFLLQTLHRLSAALGAAELERERREAAEAEVIDGQAEPPGAPEAPPQVPGAAGGLGGPPSMPYPGAGVPYGGAPGYAASPGYAAAPGYGVPQPPGPGALERLRMKREDPRVKVIFRIWIIVFGLVGAQMSWVLRPFIGNPEQPFQFFRNRESNFFQGLMDTLKHLFS